MHLVLFIIFCICRNRTWPEKAAAVVVIVIVVVEDNALQSPIL